MKKTNQVTLKCYDSNGKIWKSKPLTKFSSKFFDCLQQAELNLKAKLVFIKQGNEQQQISFNTKKETVQSCFTGSDGIKTFTIPINLKRYPLLSK